MRRVARTAASPADLPPAEELYDGACAGHGAGVREAVDAARCPYCARVRLALAEKAVAYETVEIDLGRTGPPGSIELNPPGQVPVLDDGFVLPESR